MILIEMKLKKLAILSAIVFPCSRFITQLDGCP
jgi:hypothetical protein